MCCRFDAPDTGWCRACAPAGCRILLPWQYCDGGLGHTPSSCKRNTWASKLTRNADVGLQTALEAELVLLFILWVIYSEIFRSYILHMWVTKAQIRASRFLSKVALQPNYSWLTHLITSDCVRVKSWSLTSLAPLDISFGFRFILVFGANLRENDKMTLLLCLCTSNSVGGRGRT